MPKEASPGNQHRNRDNQSKRHGPRRDGPRANDQVRVRPVRPDRLLGQQQEDPKTVSPPSASCIHIASDGTHLDPMIAVLDRRMPSSMIVYRTAGIDVNAV